MVGIEEAASLLRAIFKILWDLIRLFVALLVFPWAISRAIRARERADAGYYRTALEAGDVAPEDDAGMFARGFELSAKKRLMKATAKAAKRATKAAARAAARAGKLQAAAGRAPEAKAGKARMNAEVAKARAARMAGEAGQASDLAAKAARGYADVCAVAKAEGLAYQLQRWKRHGYPGWWKWALFVLVLAWIGWLVFKP